MEQDSAPTLRYHTYIESHWLTQKPNANSIIVVLSATLLMFLMSFTYWYHWFGFSEFLAATPSLVFHQGQFWRAWTTLFIHADAGHLLGNTFLFTILGYFLNGYFGLMVFPVMAILFGGLVNLMVLSQMPPQATLLGMSGVVFWMGAVWLLLYVFLEARKTSFQRIMRALGITLILFMPSEVFDPHISYQSHFFGFMAGLVFGLFFYLMKRKIFKGAEVLKTEIEEWAE